MSPAGKPGVINKITVVTWYYPVREEPYRGQSAYQTLLRLQHQCEVEVLCPQPQYPRWAGPRSFQHWNSDVSYQPPGPRTSYIRYPAIPVFSRPFNGPVCTRYIDRALRDTVPDLVLNFRPYPEGHAAVTSAHRIGVPAIVAVIGSDLNRIGDPISGLLTRRTLEKADFVISVSEHLRQVAISMGIHPNKIIAIHNGCDSSIFRHRDQAQAKAELGIVPEARLLVYSGRLDILKGLRELILAFAAVAPDIPRLRLVLIGEGPARSTLQHLVAELKMADRVLFAGTMPSQSVARWISASELFVFPSYAEGCPNSLIEALNCCRPVVTTNVGGIPELVDRNCGILVPPRDTEALRVALRDALNRSWDYNELSRGSKRSWEDVASETYDVCIEVRRKWDVDHATCNSDR